MSSRAQKIKSIVKGTDEKPTFGTNPLDPWSTKANISESEEGMLKRYLLSRGIDPRYVSKDTRISHAKSGEFMKWKNDRASDRVTEEVDKKDTVTFDIPLLIRVLELAREDIKSDMDLHRVVERLINMRDKGMLTMDDYDAIAAIKEEVYGSVPLNYIKQALDESKESNYGGDYQDSVKAVKAKAEKKPVDMDSLAARMQASYKRDELSKSARMIKSIYKHHKVVKEDTYDTEKDDKSIQTYGKKPKVDKMDKDAEPTKSKVQAAAVLSGGTTLTGEKRETVEIDPIMRVRPGQPDPTKNEKK